MLPFLKFVELDQTCTNNLDCTLADEISRVECKSGTCKCSAAFSPDIVDNKCIRSGNTIDIHKILFKSINVNYVNAFSSYLGHFMRNIK